MTVSRRIAFLLCFVLLTLKLNAQIDGISAGLAFSSGIDYNTGTTGNPGLFAKVYVELDKKLHIVPAIVAFNQYKRSDFSQELHTYMFHGDIDAVYGIYKDKSLRLMGFAGLNTTTIISKWKILESNPGVNLENKADFKPGLNLGGAFQLYVDDSFDAYISGKYIVSNYDQFVINVGVIYYLAGKHRKGSW